MNDNTLQQGYGSYYDYCSEIDEEDRKEHIDYLVNHALPKGMFELISDNAMRYNGGIEQWKEEYVANIRKKAEAITVENMLEWSLSVVLNRELYSTSVGSSTIISDAISEYQRATRYKTGGSLWLAPITFITYSAEFPPSASLPAYSCFKGIIPSQPRHTPQVCFRVQRYGGRTLPKYRYRYLK